MSLEKIAGSNYRGFASMDPEKQREIAVKGGKAVAPEKRGFSINHELAREAGRKGGYATDSSKRSFSTNRELAREAGKKGGRAYAAKMLERRKPSMTDAASHGDGRVS